MDLDNQRKQLFTSRLFIRPMEISDTDIIVEWRNQEYIREVSLKKKKITASEHNKWFLESREYRLDFVFFDKLSQEPIGVVSFDGSKKQSIFKNYYEMSKYIGNRKFLGKGLAYEVCSALLDELRSNKLIEGVYAVTRKDNHVNKRLNKKLGFQVYDNYQNKIDLKKNFIFMHKDFIQE